MRSRYFAKRLNAMFRTGLNINFYRTKPVFIRLVALKLRQDVNKRLFIECFEAGRKHGALRPQKPLRLIRDGEVGGREFLHLAPTRYTATTRKTLH